MQLNTGYNGHRQVCVTHICTKGPTVPRALLLGKGGEEKLSHYSVCLAVSLLPLIPIS